MENYLNSQINNAFQRVYYHQDLICSRHDHNEVDIRVFNALILAIMNGAELESISKLHDIKGNLTVYFKHSERLFKHSHIDDAKYFNDDTLNNVMAFKKAWHEVGEHTNQVFFVNISTDDTILF
jgi:hypothetical protein